MGKHERDYKDVGTALTAALANSHDSGLILTPSLVMLREIKSILCGEFLLSVKISSRRALTLLWHASERLKRKRSRSITCSENPCATIALHHILHHACQQMIHWIRTPSPVSGLVKCLSEKFIQTLTLEHLPE